MLHRLVYEQTPLFLAPSLLRSELTMLPILFADAFETAQHCL